MFKINNVMIKLAIIFIVGAIGLVAWSSSTITNKVSNDNFNKIVTTDAGGKYIVDQDAAAKVKIQPERDIIVEMHEMTNTYIIASKVWGTQEMTQERINALIVEILSTQSTTISLHKKELIEILTGWKKGEFSNLADDHNYLWDALGGQVGEATGVKGIEDLPAWAVGK